MTVNKHIIQLVAALGLGAVGTGLAHPHASHAATIGTTATTVTPQPNTTSQPADYVVQRGDTLWGLAQRYHTSVASLQQLNHISGSLIYVGQHLRLTGSQPAPAPAVHPATPVVHPAPAVHPAPVVHTTPVTRPATPVTHPVATTPSNAGGVSAAHSAAANAIAQAESGGSYTARNGQYIGRYQLAASYLHGDYSPANQDRCFVNYCNSRYGSVNNALAFRQAHGWY